MVDRIPTDIDFLEFLSLQESQEIRWATDFEAELVREAESPTAEKGARLPWPTTHGRLQFRENELTIWAGYNGHMKSMLVGYVLMHFARSERVCLASLEMKPTATMLRMARQATGCTPSTEYIRKFSQWCNGRLALYDQLDTVAPERILGMGPLRRQGTPVQARLHRLPDEVRHP